MPLLSFVVPAHDVEPYLERCTESILRSSGVEIELIAVDDGSTDGTGAFLDALAARDARVRVVHHPAALGPGPARNAGLALATGDFVWFVDGDDWLLDGAVAAVAARLDPTIDILFVGHVRVFGDGRIVPNVVSASVLAAAPHRPFTIETWPRILDVLHVPWNRIHRRSLLVGASLEFRPGVNEDVTFTYLALRRAAAITVDQRVWYAYRFGRPASMTHTPGATHLVFADVWGEVLADYATEPPEVRRTIFAAMIRHGWAVLAHPHRLHGPLRRQFFDRFAALYRSQRPAGAVRDVALELHSWTVARERLLLRKVVVAAHEVRRGERAPVLSSRR